MSLGLPLDHVGVAVRTLDEGSRPYQLLGLVQDGDDEEVASQGVRVRTLTGGGSLVELLEPTSPESPLVKFLEKRGPGVHHLAFRVDGLEAQIARLRLENAPFIDPEPKPGRGGLEGRLSAPVMGGRRARGVGRASVGPSSAFWPCSGPRSPFGCRRRPTHRA